MKINLIENTIPIKLKVSNFTLFVLHLYNYQSETVRKAIKNKIKQAPNLLKNISVIVNVSCLSSEVNWDKMQCAILSTGLKIIGVSGCKHKKLQYMILNSGIPLITDKTLKNENKSFNNISLKKSKIIYNQIRSGQKIYSKNSDLVIVNSVNSGAELISDGNIHIYGIMRGRALAGASGDVNCQIFCTSLFAELVSIAGAYWSMEQIPIYFNGKSVRLFLKKNILNIKEIN